MTSRSRKNSFDKKYRKNSGDSIDSCSHEIINNKSEFIPIRRRRVREQPLELKEPSPVPDKFRYLMFLQKK